MDQKSESPSLLEAGYSDTRSPSSSAPLLETHGLQLPSRHWKHWLCWWMSVLNTLAFSTTCIFWVHQANRDQDINAAYKATSKYSPLLDKGFPLRLDQSVMNKTLWGVDEMTSIYIQEPSPEVDAARDYISAESASIVTINSEEAVLLDRDPSVIVKAPKDWGFGDDAYPAQIDVFHEIHCLNVLRKEMYWDYYHRAKYGNPEDADYLYIRHKKHCLRIVLRTLMCNADVNIVTHNWHRGSRRPIADFENPRQCRNFEAVLEWSMAHAVPDDMEKWRTIQRPANAVILPRPTPNLYIAEDSYDWIHSV